METTMRRSYFSGLPVEDAATGIVSTPQIEGWNLTLDLTNELLVCAQRPQIAHFVRDETERTLLVRFRPDADPAFYFEKCEREQDGGRTSFIKLAKCSQRTVDEARQIARNNKMRVERREPVEITKRPRRGFTVAETIESYEKTLSEQFSYKTTWQRKKFALLNAHISSAFGPKSITSLRRAEWLDPIERLKLRQPSSGSHLHRATKALLNHAVDVGALDANPLAGTKSNATHAPQPRNLDERSLGKVMLAAEKLGEPWRTIIGLVIATGESAEDIRHIQRDHIDFERADWFKFHRIDQGPWGTPDDLSVPLNSVALALLAPYRDHDGFLFSSSDPRREGQPIHVRAEIGVKICDHMQSDRRLFTVRTLRKAVRYHAYRNKKPTREASDAWGKTLADILSSLKGEDVIL
jgi:integrase